jgi:hypothetical protein
MVAHGRGVRNSNCEIQEHRGVLEIQLSESPGVEDKQVVKSRRYLSSLPRQVGCRL